MVEETIEIGDTEVEIRETDDGFEAVEVENSQPDVVCDYIWNKAKRYTVDQEDIVVHDVSIESLVMVEDGDGDLWVQVDGEPIAGENGRNIITSMEKP